MTLSSLLGGGVATLDPPCHLYVHVPFCELRCAYCDFHSFSRHSAGLEVREAYVDALAARLASIAGSLTAPIETIYIGGGTPTSLGDRHFAILLKATAALAGKRVREWTVEANPESLDERKLDLMRSNGVTRLSLGIQSMNDDDLSALGRHARAIQGISALDRAARSGLDISADIMCGIPRPRGYARKYASDGSPSSLAETAALLIDHGVGHISMYDLVLEEGTPLEKAIGRGDLVLPEEDIAFEARKTAEKYLAGRGFLRYEVSNFAPPGKESAHNGAYWALKSYLGIGSGAVSTLVRADGGAWRIEEGKNLGAYLKNPDSALEVTEIGKKDFVFENIMMGLRTARGVDMADFRRRFGIDLPGLLAGTRNRWKDRFIEQDGRLAVDDEGLDILNRILVTALEEVDSWFSCGMGERLSW